MSNYKINMAQVFALAFGVGSIPLGYKIPANGEGNPAFDYSELRAVDESEIKGQSFLGTPINFRFSFKGGNYQMYEGGQLITREIEDFQMPLTTMVDISRSKRQTLTPTAGGDGAVIEMYSFNNWSVRIRGVCLLDPGHPQAEQAREQKRRILELENLADSIELVQEDNLFTDRGIYRLFIQRLRSAQLPGKPNWYPFELDCISDKPAEFSILS